MKLAIAVCVPILILLAGASPAQEAATPSSEMSDEEGRLMLEQGRSLMAEGRPLDALPFFQQTVDLAEARLGDGSPALAHLLHELASVYAAAAQPHLAAEQYRRALQILEGVFGGQHQELLPTLSDLASLLARGGRHQEAEQTYRRVLDLLRSSYGDGDAEVVSTLGQLALLSQYQGKTSEAEALYREAMAVADRFRLETPETATAVNNYAALEAQRSRYAEAVPLFRRAHDLRRRLLGPKHWLVAVSAGDLAVALDQLGQSDEALKWAREAADILGPACTEAGDGDARELCRQIQSLQQRLAKPAPTPPQTQTPEAPQTPDAQPTRDTSQTAAQTPPSQEGPSDRGVYRCQLASRSQPEAARAELEALRQQYGALLAGLPAQIEVIDLGAKGIWHRLQFGAFAERSAAEQLCRDVKSAGWNDCWVVSPTP